MALLISAEPNASAPKLPHADLDDTASLVAAARSVVAAVVDRAHHDQRPRERLVALLELDLVDADLARAQARLRRLRREATTS